MASSASLNKLRVATPVASLTAVTNCQIIGKQARDLAVQIGALMRPVSKVANGVHVVAMHIALAPCVPARTWRRGGLGGDCGIVVGRPK